MCSFEELVTKCIRGRNYFQEGWASHCRRWRVKCAHHRSIPFPEGQFERSRIKLTANFLKACPCQTRSSLLVELPPCDANAMVSRYCKMQSSKSILKGSPIWPFGLQPGHPSRLKRKCRAQELLC